MKEGGGGKYASVKFWNVTSLGGMLNARRGENRWGKGGGRGDYPQPECKVQNSMEETGINLE